jgi:DNA-binding CsgD family transcriptional regulator
MKNESITSKFFAGICKDCISAENAEPDSSYLSGIADLSWLFSGGVFVMDFQKRCLPVISHCDIFLCGYPAEHAAQLGYEFFCETVHENDLLLFIKIHRAILKSEYIIDEELQSQIKYFYFTLRVKDYPTLYSRQDWLMLCYKIKPVFIKGKIRYGLCYMSISQMSTSGNLTVYFSNNRIPEKYTFDIDVWTKCNIKPLTEREIEILRLAKRGLNEYEIADLMCRTYGRIRHSISDIYRKLGVKNMEQAITFAANHLMLFDFR